MRYLLFFFMVMSLCVAPVWAEDDGDGDGDGGDTQVLNVTAENYRDLAKEFTNSYLGNIDGLDKNQLLKDFDELATEVKTKDDYDPAKYYKPQDYMDGVKEKVDATLPKLSKSRDADIKQNYLTDVAINFLIEYFKDMRDETTNISTADYLKDFDRLGEAKVQDVYNRDNPPKVEDTEELYNPEDYLDSVASKRVGAKIEFSWGGANNDWLNKNLVTLIGIFQDKFKDVIAQEDFKALQSMWPQGSEVYLMNTSYNQGYASGSLADRQAGKFKSTYFVNEYGKMLNEDEVKDNNIMTQQYDGTARNAPPAITTGVFNNRSYGYKYANTTNTTIKITTNGREYRLQERFYTSPLVLDMDGNGKLEASNGKHLPHEYAGGKLVEFDIDGDGFLDISEWVGANDGLLIVYKGGDVSGNNLFGTPGGFIHGYEKLSLLDKDHNKKISGDELKTLSIWQDKNGNAHVDSGEISSMEDLGITSISLRHDQQLISSFVQNGVTKKMWDWYPTMYRGSENHAQYYS